MNGPLGVLPCSRWLGQNVPAMAHPISTFGRAALGRAPFLAALGPLLALAACSSSPSGNATTSTTTQAANRTPTSSTTGVVPSYSPTENARPYVEQNTCSIIGGAWVDKGTVDNSTQSPHGFTIVVDFVTAKGNTVMDTDVVHVGTVRPGKTAQWSATDPQDRAGLACIVRFSQFSG